MSEARQLEAGILVDDVPQRGLKLLDVDVLGVDPAQGMPVDALRRVPRGLARPQVAAEAEYREQVPFGGVGELGVRPRQRTKVGSTHETEKIVR